MDKEKIQEQCRDAFEHGYHGDDKQSQTAGTVNVLLDVIEQLEDRISKLEGSMDAASYNNEHFKDVFEEVDNG